LAGVPLTLAEISDLRAYERERESFRREVIELKRRRRVSVGPIVTAVFENRTTMRFQVQEMARAERMLSDEQIQAELDVYNPLIPGPGELSLTVFLELTTEEQLRRWLPELVGVERAIELRIGEGASSVVVRAEVEEAHEAQLTREETTASVHYVHFVLSPSLWQPFRAGPAVLAVAHPSYRHEALLPEETRLSLVSDWDGESRES
jgi:hypothetical protein